jgi:DNA-binding NarL/FixJ family response regulator
MRGLPGMIGIEFIRRIHERWPAISPVMLTVYDDDERILEALGAGANRLRTHSEFAGAASCKFTWRAPLACRVPTLRDT